MRNISEKHVNRLRELFFDLFFPVSDREHEIRNITPEDLAPHLHIQERNGVTTLFDYHNPTIQEMIWFLKYHGNTHVAQLFGAVLYEYVLEFIGETQPFEASNYTLVPVPLSTKRKRERGFNQVERIARIIQAENAHLFTLAPNALKKIRHTTPQTQLNRTERLKNIQGSFVAQKELVAGKNIILVDDVVTTGTTLKEAKKVLREAGAHAVHCIAIAG